MKIGALARQVAMSVDTIRHYERAGLLPAPPRSEGNYRVYGAADASRLSFIRHCRQLDIGLADIRTLLTLRDAPQADCGLATEVLERQLAHLTQRLAEMRALQRQLLALRAQCDHSQPAAACGILAGLATP